MRVRIPPPPQKNPTEVGFFLFNNFLNIYYKTYMETTQLDITEIKKELIKSRTLAHFSHYVAGNLYYKVELSSGTYQFPIPTVENEFCMSSAAEYGLADISDDRSMTIYELSSDLGTTAFDNEIKASFLNRWIQKAVKKDEFIRV